MRLSSAVKAVLGQTVEGDLCEIVAYMMRGQVVATLRAHMDVRAYETVLVQTMNASPEFWGLAESMG